MEEWDLQAVVRSRTGVADAFSNAMDAGQNSRFAPLGVALESRLLEAATAKPLELGELYKPFYPLSSQTSLASSIFAPQELKNFQERPKKHLLTPGSDANGIPEAKLKKSKKQQQQKRVVKQVTNEGLSSDIWAWRKYGQKPIKGSPYPRSYYRCSSAKGCLARKLVEKNPSNPEIFIVTYTNEHSHGLPTKRNSSAGLTRKMSVTAENSPRNESKDLALASPTSNPSTTFVQDYLAQQKVLNQENTEQMARGFEGINEILSPDLMLGTELFSSLGHMDELLTSKEFDFDGCFFD